MSQTAPDLAAGGAVRPELELLLCLARTALDSETRVRAGNLLARHLDWEYLVRQALRHRLAYLLYTHLSSRFSEVVPSRAMADLRSHFHTNACRNLYLTRELCAILRLLEANGVAAIPFKGPVLAQSLFGNVALREYGDLDILVRQRDFPIARDLLLAEGFRPSIELSPTEQAYAVAADGQLEFRRASPIGNVFVDIHWDFAPGFFSIPFDLASLWQRLGSTSLTTARVPAFAPEDLLLLLCLHHGVMHLWQRWDRLCEIAQVIRNCEALKWDTTLREARALGIRRAVFVGLHLASKWLGAAIPSGVLASVRADPQIHSTAALIEDSLFGDEGGGVQGVQAHLFRMRLRDRFGDKLRYCLHLALTTNRADWGLIPLPAPLFPLYSVLRPARLVGTYWKQTLSR